jgi:hypothetical protein
MAINTVCRIALYSFVALMGGIAILVSPAPQVVGWGVIFPSAVIHAWADLRIRAYNRRIAQEHGDRS